MSERTEMMWRKREESGRREIGGVPMPCAKEMGLIEGSVYGGYIAMCANGQ